MQCRVLFFAGLRDLTGRNALDLELPGAERRVEEIRSEAEERCPELSGRTYSVAVEARYADDEQIVADGAEVAFLPPVSGG